MATYKGYTSVGRDYVTTSATDAVLIRADLTNHFNTRVGERVMNPDFGCIIWDYIFDPFTDDVRYAIIENVQEIISGDPRVVLNNLDIQEYEHGLQVELDLFYAKANQVDKMVVTFDSRTGTARSD
jgi:phage baseplate assembly protein W